MREPPNGGGEDGGAALFLAGTVFAVSKNNPKKIKITLKKSEKVSIGIISGKCFCEVFYGSYFS